MAASCRRCRRASIQRRRPSSTGWGWIFALTVVTGRVYPTKRCRRLSPLEVPLRRESGAHCPYGRTRRGSGAQAHGDAKQLAAAGPRLPLRGLWSVVSPPLREAVAAAVRKRPTPRGRWVITMCLRVGINSAGPDGTGADRAACGTESGTCGLLAARHADEDDERACVRSVGGELPPNEPLSDTNPCRPAIRM